MICKIKETERSKKHNQDNTEGKKGGKKMKENGMAGEDNTVEWKT